MVDVIRRLFGPAWRECRFIIADQLLYWALDMIPAGEEQIRLADHLSRYWRVNLAKVFGRTAR